MVLSDLQNDSTPLARYVVFGFIALCTVIAIGINPANLPASRPDGNGLPLFVELLSAELGSVSFSSALAACFSVAFLWRYIVTKKCGLSIDSLVLSLVFSVFMIVGMSFIATHTFALINLCFEQFFIACIVFVGFAGLLYVLILFFFERIEMLSQYDWAQNASTVSNPVIKFWLKHFLIISMLILLVCWTLFAFPLFPGSIPHDTRYQLNQFFGLIQMNLHHPFYSTMLIGAIYSLGKSIGGIVCGCLACVIVQSLLGAYVFSQICNYVLKKTGSFIWAALCLAFYAITPLWWGYMQAVVKDTLYFILFSWFVLEVMKCLLDKRISKASCASIVLIGIACCMFRNEGQFEVLVMLATLIIVIDKGIRRAIIAAFCIVFAANFCLNTLLLNQLNLSSDNQVEAMSIPLQQVALCVVEHGDELTREDIDAIDGIVAFDGIPERYDPEISDPIKNRYRNSSPEDWSKFWALWFDLLQRHPESFVTAATSESYGYFYPLYNMHMPGSGYQFYTKEPFGSYDKDVIYSSYAFPSTFRESAVGFALLWDNVPLLSFLVAPGAYTWALLLLFWALMRKRRSKEAAVFVLPALVILICMASPVNGALRYFLPIAACMPLFSLVALLPYCKNAQALEPTSSTEMR